MLYSFAARRYRHPDGTAIFTNNPTEVLFDVWATQKPKKRNERYVRPEKLGAVWLALNELRASLLDWQSVAGADVARFAFVTGCRRREVTTLTWDRVDLHDDPAKCRFKLVDRKRGDDIWLPLNDLAVELLKQRQPLNDSRYVFPSRAPRGHIDDARAAMVKVSEVTGQTLSLHDARRTFSNVALRCRVGKYEVDMLTGHEPSQSDVTSSAYLDLTDRTWLHDASQKVADVIRLEAAKAAGTNVVKLESRA
jgi:integrase